MPDGMPLDGAVLTEGPALAEAREGFDAAALLGGGALCDGAGALRAGVADAVGWAGCGAGLGAGLGAGRGAGVEARGGFDAAVSLGDGELCDGAGTLTAGVADAVGCAGCGAGLGASLGAGELAGEV